MEIWKPIRSRIWAGSQLPVSVVTNPVKTPPYLGLSAEADVGAAVADGAVVVGFGAVVAAVVLGAEVLEVLAG